ncbi:AbrB/MazE/SpoVT family DNA-binding domain-containing protein [Marinimicrobium agarilyticum]|uniref:AbrB/MazE/SpoVT family DNA-binding domain-containing protein n=1 Tax=Marinimicrobium agarilyticum TaxID=306546 RepID=UPI00048421A4|nr:AbrB/MazE/SpoVT family DNA-binding domain-containing protein [Marinimicrobium agarilyticum]
MATVAIRKSGGGSIVTLPKAILETMHLEVGSSLDLTIEANKIVLTPRRKDPSLEELLEGITPDMLAPTEEDREWLDDQPMGKELF